MEFQTNPYAAPNLAGNEPQPRRAASTGGVHFLLFPLAAVACLMAAGAMAWVLAAVFLAGWYFLMLVPLAAAAVVALAVHFSIRQGRCRNRWLGLALGAGCGCVLYLGYYHFDMVNQVGRRLLPRIDALPGWIAFRIQNDVSRDVHRPADVEPRKPLWVMNLLMFLAEFALVLWITSLVGFRTASRAFDEARGRWGSIRYSQIAPGQSQLLVTAWQQGTLESALQQTSAVPFQLNTPQCMVVLEQFAAWEGESPRAFLSAYEIKMPGQSPAINELLYFKRLALRQRELMPAEQAACEHLFGKQGSSSISSSS